jgi:AraC-like DNA-binding protein
MRHANSPAGPPGRTTIRASALTPLYEYLVASPIDESGLLAEQNLRVADLADPYSVVALSQYVALFEASAAALDDASLGLRIGMKARPADMGPMGVLFSLSPTLRVGMQRLAAYVMALQGGTQSSLFEADDELVWTYRPSDPALWPRRQDAEYTLAAVCQLIRSSFASDWRPVEVHFEHGEEADPALLQRFFRAPVLYRQPCNRLILRRSDALRVYRAEDKGLVTILEHHIGDLIRQSTASLSVTESVRNMIGAFLGKKPISVATLAAEMGMSPRSFQRHLAEAGTSLRVLLREHREALAVTHLAETGAQVAQVADALGYADGTVFWRAYRSWTGQEPSALRKRGTGKSPSDTGPEG